METVKRKSILIIVLVILEIICMFLMYKSLSDKKTQIDDVALNDKNIISEDMFALMIQQEDKSYIESESNTWPTEGYKFNTEKSGCINMNGEKIENALSYNENTKKITITTTKTSYCYFYFDKASNGGADKLIQEADTNGLWQSGLEDDVLIFNLFNNKNNQNFENKLPLYG